MRGGAAGVGRDVAVWLVAAENLRPEGRSYTRGGEKLANPTSQ